MARIPHRCGLWLWCRLAAVALISTSSLGTPICLRCGYEKGEKKKKERKKKKKKEKLNNPIYHHTKRIKYLGMNLPKDAKNLYSENYKTLWKEIKDDISRWKDTPFSLLEESILSKSLYYPRQSTESVQSLSNY